ncbi:hypothetical protein GCM10009642_66180 [Nocardiopsis metallicus]
MSDGLHSTPWIRCDDAWDTRLRDVGQTSLASSDRSMSGSDPTQGLIVVSDLFTFFPDMKEP